MNYEEIGVEFDVTECRLIGAIRTSEIGKPPMDDDEVHVLVGMSSYSSVPRKAVNALAAGRVAKIMVRSLTHDETDTKIARDAARGRPVKLILGSGEVVQGLSSQEMGDAFLKAVKDKVGVSVEW